MSATQQRLFDDSPLAKRVPAPHNSTPTSIAAAEAVTLKAGTGRARIVAWLKTQRQHGGTNDEIAEACDMLLHAVCARVNELTKQGFLVAKGERPSTAGHAAAVRVCKEFAK